MVEKVDETKQIKRKPRGGKHFGVYCTELHIGTWKKKFSSQQRTIMIVSGLNKLTDRHKEKCHILGYLITNRRVCLIVEIERNNMERVLEDFNSFIAKEIHLALHENSDVYVMDALDGISEGKLMGALFTAYPFYNNDLMRLLTGRVPNYDYYNPHLEKMRDHLRNYNFSSALDYTGAKSTVKVTLKDTYFWEHELKTTQEVKIRWVDYLIKKEKR